MWLDVKILMMAVLLMPVAALAANDDFGSRFSDASPAALSEQPQEAPAALATAEPSALQLQDIEPASGAETEAEPSDEPYELESGLERDSGYESDHTAPLLP